MTPWAVAVASLAAGLVSALVTGAGVHLFPRLGMVDRPNERSSHGVPTPRGGGVGIVCGLLVGLMVLAAMGQKVRPGWLGLPVMLVATVGFLDDVRGLSPVLRLAAQLMAAALVVTLAGPLSGLPLPALASVSLGWFGLPLAILWVVGVTNLYNFLDGIDGFAGLQAVLAGAAIAVAYPESALGPLGWLLAGASLGFLGHNRPPARIFMGDVGSCTLGFLFAAFPFTLPDDARPEAVWLVAMALWFFLADGTFTILRRLLRGERVWEAHRSHLYQRLVRAGWSHGKVAGSVMAVGVVVALAAALSVRLGSGPGVRWAVSAVAVAGFAGYAALVRFEEFKLRSGNRRGPEGSAFGRG